MSHIPPKSKRQYQRPIYQLIAGHEKLVIHDCAKCHTAHKAEDKGTWFERADQRGVWVWVCDKCKPNA